MNSRRATTRKEELASTCKQGRCLGITAEQGTCSRVKKPLIGLLILGVFLFAMALPVLAQDKFPSRPVTIIIPWSPGALVDNIGRRLSQPLTELLRQPIVIQNLGGSGGNAGAAQLARSKPDGYTLGLTLHDSLVITKAANLKVGFDPIADLIPVGLVGNGVTVLVVRSDSRFQSLGELIKYAKANPGKLNFGSNGVGTSLHLALERLNAAAGMSIVHVPYKGGAPAMVDLLGGRVDLVIASVSLSQSHIKAGTIRPLAISSAQRSELFPGVLPIAELGFPGFDVPSAPALFAPKGTPRALVDRLNADLRSVVAEPEISAWLKSSGITPELKMTASEMETLMKREVAEVKDMLVKFKIEIE
jgi:tripartite-type tricarboxylate transporter receptor subunit TctC